MHTFCLNTLYLYSHSTDESLIYICFEWYFQYGPRYDWSQPIQGHILGSYFWGYVPSSLVGGWLAERIGPFHVLFWSHVIIGILNSVTVFGIYIHVSILIVCRIIIGLGAVSFILINQYLSLKKIYFIVMY